MSDGAGAVRRIPLAVPDLTGNEKRYLAECIDTGFVSSVGQFVPRFEAMVADAMGAPAATATSSGTTALHLALVTAGVRPGDLVIVPSLTFIATANAVSACGADPWILDIEPQSWTLDPSLLARCLDEATALRQGAAVHLATRRRVAAVLPVYVMGAPADMDPIVASAHAHGLPVVADAAAALGATYKGHPLGAIGADLSVISFNGNKTVTAGSGGAVGGAAPLVARARHLAATARVGDEYDHDEVGFNYRMSNVQAAVGCAQLERLAAFVDAKRRIASRYAQALAGLPGAMPFPQPAWAESACWLSGLVLEDAGRAEALRRHLAAAGLPGRRFWKPLHLQAPYRCAPRTAQPVAEALWQRIVPLPCSTGLREADQDYVIEQVLSAAPGPTVR